MGSSGKKRSTVSKLNREGRVREKRAEKAARKAARKLSGSADGSWAASAVDETGIATVEPESSEAEELRAGAAVGAADLAGPGE